MSMRTIYVRRARSCLVLLSTVFLIFFSALWVEAGSSSTLSSPPTQLPRSKSGRTWSSETYPPWNPSPRIKYDGFLRDSFVRIPGEWEEEVRLRTRQRLETRCRIRQVPGDGNCLFHSISLCLQHANNGTHWDLPRCLDELFCHSQSLRRQAVECLRQPHKRLFLQGRETLRSGDLVQAAAQQYGLTSEEYCEAMEQDCVWGGGPEIVALSNILRRPIHVYELHQSSSSTDGPPCFVLRRMACFGSPRFDQQEALHILSADSRFPDLIVGEQMPSGNHFLAVFPLRQKRLRGGGEGRQMGCHRNEFDCNDEDHWVDWEASAEPRWAFWNWLKFLQ